MSIVVVDDHLLRDILTNQRSSEFEAAVGNAEIYTTNLWYLRLCRGAAASVGGRLTAALDAEQRRALAGLLLRLPSHIGVVPLHDVAWQMAERHAEHRLSTLSCEALVAAQHLGADVCVWRGDDGPNLRAACLEVGIAYSTVD